VVDEIQTYSRPIIEHCYREFLFQSHDPEEREYPDDIDQIQEILIHEKYLSQKDIEICLGFDLTLLGSPPEIENIRHLHEKLTYKYGSENKHGAL